MKKRRTLPPTYFLSALVVMALMHWGMPITELVSYPWNMIGVVPLLIGGLLNLVADAAFKKRGTTVKPFEASTTLITDGVFRVSRHPMYLGMVLILCGLAILMGSLSPFIVVIVFGILMEQIFIRIEESMLFDKFGTAWLEYKTQTRKWL